MEGIRTPTRSDRAFLASGGEMGEFVRAYDWSTTPLGPPETWPHSLRTTLGLVLHSAFPMFLFWGDDLTCFYNDAYRPSLGQDGKHPAVGKPGREVWPEIWDFIGPLIEHVMKTGEAAWFEDQLVPIHRNGRLEDVYWTFSYSPAYGDDGHITGVLVTCAETTEKVLGFRRLEESRNELAALLGTTQTRQALLLKLSDALRPLTDPEEIQYQAARVLGEQLGVDRVGYAEAQPDGETIVVTRNFTRDVPGIEGYYRYADYGAELVREFNAGRTVVRPDIAGHPQLTDAEKAAHTTLQLGATVNVPLVKEGRLVAVLFVHARHAHDWTGEEVALIEEVAGRTWDAVERSRAETALRESEAHFRRLTDTVPVILWMTDPDGYCTYLNAQWYAYTGQTEAEAEGFGWLDATHPDDKAEAGRRFLEANERREPFSLLYRLRRHDGTYRWAIDAASPRFSTEGAYEGIIGTVVDVHDQKMAEESLRASEQRFQAAVTAVQGILWTNNARGEMEGEQPGWAALTGQRYDEYQGYGWASAVHPDDAQPTIDAWNEALRRRGTFNFEHRVRVQSGGWELFSIRAIPLMNPDGAIREWVGVHTNITRQRNAEAAVRASEAKLQSLIAAAPVAIGLFVGRELIIELPNQTFIDIVGKGPDIAGKPLREVMPELLTENQPFLQILDDVYTSGRMFQSFGSQVKIVRDGVMTHNFYNITYTPLFNEAGEVYAILDVAVDVTGQVLTQQALEKSEQNLRSLVESAPFPIGVYVGHDMRIELANQSILNVWGKGSEVIGKRYADVLPELATQEIFAQLDSVYTTGAPFHAKNQRVDLMADGALRPYYFNYSFTPLFDGSGQVYGVMNTAADVTDLVLAKQQVEEAEAALRGAIELAELGTWELDVATNTVHYSDRIKSWFGFAGESVTHGVAYNPIHEKDRDRVQTAILRALEPGSDGLYDEEYALVDQQTGYERLVRAQGIAYFDPEGKPLKISGTAQDVTEQRRVQQELERQVQERTTQLQASVRDLERSNQNLQQFAYVASHDLQEPLRKIQQFGDRLKTRHAESLGDGAELIDRMQSAANRMSVLIRDLLSFSRIATQQDVDEPVPLGTVVETALHDLELVVGETGARVTVGPLPTVPGDASQLGQLFQNLLSNALKFRRRDVVPVVTVTAHRVKATDLPATVRPTRPAGAYHRIDVADNGIGFDEQYLDRIFQVFQRLHGRSDFAGTGIGLAICEKVAANHGGAITARSQPDEGATFSVYLPDSQVPAVK